MVYGPNWTSFRAGKARINVFAISEATLAFSAFPPALARRGSSALVLLVRFSSVWSIGLQVSICFFRAGCGGTGFFAMGRFRPTRKRALFRRSPDRACGWVGRRTCARTRVCARACACDCMRAPALFRAASGCFRARPRCFGLFQVVRDCSRAGTTQNEPEKS